MNERARQIWQITYATKFAMLFDQNSYCASNIHRHAEKCADVAVEQYKLSRAAAKLNRYKGNK